LLKVNVRRAVKGRNEMDVSMSAENGHSSSMMGSLRPPIVRKSKLVVVDLAGSERIDKSGECILSDNDWRIFFLILLCLHTFVLELEIIDVTIVCNLIKLNTDVCRK
jgi:hypothetical protein